MIIKQSDQQDNQNQNQQQNNNENKQQNQTNKQNQKSMSKEEIERLLKAMQQKNYKLNNSSAMLNYINQKLNRKDW